MVMFCSVKLRSRMDAENNEDNERQYRIVGRLVAGELIERIERIKTEGSDK